ncbi:MAG TPA: hypothetical protein VHL09_14380 [Dehalococcoidia bacterium]|nr:hypothetical protein [Dehalococcoidia bacterium]
MQRLADRYRGRIQADEYGNEPNTHDFLGKKNPDPAEFAWVMTSFHGASRRRIGRRSSSPAAGCLN